MFLLCTKYDQKNCIDIMWKNTLISNKAIENCHAGTALMKKKKTIDRHLRDCRNTCDNPQISKSGKGGGMQKFLRRLKWTLKIDFDKIQTKAVKHVKQIANILILFVSSSLAALFTKYKQTIVLT